MWRRTYLLLVLIRLWFALSPSYLHPDENFQGPEVIAGTLYFFRPDAAHLSLVFLGLMLMRRSRLCCPYTRYKVELRLVRWCPDRLIRPSHALAMLLCSGPVREALLTKTCFQMHRPDL